jgi:hypothetical protein
MIYKKMEVKHMAKCTSGAIEYILKEGDTIYQHAGKYNTTVFDILAINPGVLLRPGQILCIPQGSHMSVTQGNKYISFKEMVLRNALRALWEQHVAWTRMTILAFASGAPYLPVVVTRLLRNAADMASALKPYYGDAKANKFGDLIKSHLQIAYQLVLLTLTSRKRT